MSFLAILHFNDLSINLLESHISFKEEIDFTGRPSGPPRLTNVRCIAEASKDTSLWEWAIANSRLINLKLEYRPVHLDGKSRTYYFYDSNCHFYKESFSHEGRSNYRFIIEFVAGIFKTDTVVLEKHWKVTDLRLQNIEPTRITESKPELVKYHIEDIAGNKIDKEEIEYDEEIVVVVESKNAVGQTLVLKLDDRRLDYVHKGNPLKEDTLEVKVTGDLVYIPLKAIQQQN